MGGVRTVMRRGERDFHFAARRISNRKGIDGIVRTLQPAATMGAYEENPLSALLIYGYELSRNNSFA